MKLVFFVSEDWYFCSHRLSLAVAAKDAGFDVAVVTRVNRHGSDIESAGIRLLPISLSRSGKNPITEFLVMLKLWKIYKAEQPDILHHVALKPVLYGSFAARLAGVSKVVNALAGLGYVFTSTSLQARFARPIVRRILRSAITANNHKLILQNPDDVRMLCESGIADPDRVTLIRGSGVDLNEYAYSVEPNTPTIVVLASRMLWDKGVGEFVDAARYINSAKIRARFVLVGDNDSANPSSISSKVIQEWRDEGAVEVWGHRTNMAAVIADCHIVCLPSYREGLPKVLIEAAASGRPIVATDVPGCREVVENEYNGFLVPDRNSDKLAHALGRLIESPELRASMGRRSRQLAEERFSIEKVVADTLALYSELNA